MDSTKADRLRNVAEVAGWMADGKAIQQQDRDGKWYDIEAEVDAIAERIMRCGQKYRVKPEPVVVEAIAQTSNGWLVIVLGKNFAQGDRVRVTKLEN